ncbi:O-methyltransferase [Boudabousia tangfeifanii]|uniref:O-methyltransferase n=1 Tax=Boudabousia tangfeifanii TaxID=1912795 RepID=UPI000A5042AE
MDIALSWDFTEEFVTEDEVLTQARLKAEELGASPVPPSVGALLKLLANLSGARAVFEIGTGGGVSGLYLLSGMPANGVLTSIDAEGEFQRLARANFTAAGYESTRVRLFNARALDMMPRMNQGAYDLVFIDGDSLEVPYYLPQADRMLRPGGLLIITHALLGGDVANPAKRDEKTAGMRQVVTDLGKAEDYETTVLPVADGLLVAHKVAAAN